jgi:hypothetical protein
MAVSIATGPCKEEIKKERAACAPLEKKHGTGSLKIGESMDAMCADDDCRKARECLLSPHEPSRCCDGLTPHHIVPVHCFMPPGERKKGGAERYEGCEGYDPKKAPCICVEGEDKTKVHGEIHKLLDASEDKHLDKNGQAGSWSYSQASTAGINAASEATGCDKDCLRAQVHAYHKNNAGPNGNGPDLKSGTQLRADSSGNRVLGPEVPSLSTTGSGVGGF